MQIKPIIMLSLLYKICIKDPFSNAATSSIKNMRDVHMVNSENINSTISGIIKA